MHCVRHAGKKTVEYEREKSVCAYSGIVRAAGYSITTWVKANTVDI